MTPHGLGCIVFLVAQVQMHWPNRDNIDLKMEEFWVEKGLIFALNKGVRNNEVTCIYCVCMWAFHLLPPICLVGSHLPGD